MKIINNRRNNGFRKVKNKFWRVGTPAKIKWFHRIRVRLISSFMVPVAFIVLLGIVSFTKASDGITTSYENSTVQALGMAEKYLEFAFDSIYSTGNQYCNDESIKKYLMGLYDLDTIEKSNKLAEILNSINTKKTTDKFVNDIYIIPSQGQPISTVKGISKEIYNEFMNTELGKKLKENRIKQYWIASDSYLDEKLTVGSDQYALRLIRMIPGVDAVFILDVKMEAVQEVLNSLEFDETGILRVVTADGKEIKPTIADEFGISEITEEQIFINEEFYIEAANSDIKEESKLVQYKNQSYLFMHSKIGDTGAVICGLVPRSTILEQADGIKSITKIIALISIAAAIGTGSVIASGIDKVIKSIIAKLKVSAQGDLTVDFNIKRSDEFMILIEEIKHTFSKMNNLIVQVKNSCNEVSTLSTDVTDASKHFVKSSEEIALAMNEIEAGVNQQAKDAEECLKQMDSLSKKIEIVSDNTKEIRCIADDAKLTVRQGTEKTKELNLRTLETARTAAEIVNVIQNLEKKSSSIGEIIQVINEIANQTNLLSLNASIEAARAGEAGRGFAVVSSQIRILADQSKESVNSIKTIIEGIQRDTKNAANIAGQVENAISMQEKVVNNTTESYHDINESVENLVVYLKEISENVSNMAEARETTLGAIESISAVLEEMGASSNNINQSANEQLISVEVLNKSAGNLERNAGVLAEAVNKFKV